jgi:hypothetical protein
MNLTPRLGRKLLKSHAPKLFRLIHPDDFCVDFYLLHGSGRNAKLDWPSQSQSGRGVESKTLPGRIHDDPTALRFELDVGELLWSRSLDKAAFGVHCCSKLLGAPFAGLGI